MADIISRDDLFSTLSGGAKWPVSVAIKRGNPIPLDDSCIFQSKGEAETYAATSPVAYPTQIIAVMNADGTNEYYGISQQGTLEEFGGSVDVDDKSIMIDGEKLSLKNFGKQYYQWDSEAGSHKENPTTGFASGLTPRVIQNLDGEFELAWYQPSTVTVEDVSSLVATLQSDIANIKATLYGDGTDENTGLVAKVNNMYTNDVIDQKIQDVADNCCVWGEELK